MTATLRFDVVSNGAPARRDLAQTRQEVDRFGKSTDRIGASSERNRGKVSRFGGAIGGLTKTMGPLAAAAAGAAVVKFGIDAIKAASDTQQAFGAIDAVFKRNGDRVKKWANGAATSVGLARSEYANLAVVLGASLKNSGIEDYTKKTDQLIRKGADLAATFGGTTSEAVSALSSLLRGESDPIERYGVSIKQSDVNARLAADGLGKLEGKAKRTAEQQARLALVMEQTTDATGAFSRESGTLAGQQQRLSAQWTNLKDKAGQFLIPALTKVLGVANQLVTGKGKLADIARKLGNVYKAYLTPIVGALKGAVDKAKKAFTDAGGSTEDLKLAADKLYPIAKKVAGIMGKGVAIGIGIAATAIGTLIAAISRVIGWIDTLIRKAKEVKDALANVSPGALLDKGLSLLPGRNGDPRMAGLARAAAYQYSSSGRPSVQLTSSPRVTVEVDSQAMARLFRVIVRDEIQSVLGRAPQGVTV